MYQLFGFTPSHIYFLCCLIYPFMYFGDQRFCFLLLFWSQHFFCCYLLIIYSLFVLNPSQLSLSYNMSTFLILCFLMSYYCCIDISSVFFITLKYCISVVVTVLLFLFVVTDDLLQYVHVGLTTLLYISVF